MNLAKGEKLFMYVIASIVVASNLVIVYALFKVDVPEGNKSTLMLVIGNLLAGYMTVIGFLFGSSIRRSNNTEITNNP
jgi:hypothetical protein